jgi:hypothetical protein
VGVFIMLGARRMVRLRSYGRAVTTGILAVLPLSFGFMIGVPMGIWALIVLYRPDVQAAFAANARKQHGTKATHPSQRVVPATPVSRARRVGQLSLIAAILGCVVPIILCIIFWILEENSNMHPPYWLCLFVFLGLELVALASGIAGWRSPYGKAGTFTALLFLLATTLLVPIYSSHRPGDGTSPAPVESLRMVQPQER